VCGHDLDLLLKAWLMVMSMTAATLDWWMMLAADVAIGASHFTPRGTVIKGRPPRISALFCILFCILYVILVYQGDTLSNHRG
jgi:hypothetical protein